MIRHISILMAVIFSATIHISAKTISPRAALERVTSSSETGLIQPLSSDAVLEYTLAYSTPSGSYHVFNRSTGGYIVVSGDDEIYPLLADISTGAFSSDGIAPSAGWILNMYDSQISSFTRSTASGQDLMNYYTQWTEIAPLMTTTWNQDYPYNKYCPAVDGQLCVTGCVATALAQVVKHIGYYEGKGYRSYSGNNINGDKVEFDYEANTFDFDSMLESYGGSESEESIDQVARLMLACGLGVTMDYGVKESTAMGYNITTALINNFGYDKKNTIIHYRSRYTQAQWENILYRELQLGRPVNYIGYKAPSGHAFVIDGYRPTGLFHVNWGWGGISDGYFRLTALSPSQIGIGGNVGGYNSAQEMVQAVPPGADPGVKASAMGGSINVVSPGVYSVYYRSNGVSNFNVAVGAVIVDENGNRAATATFWAEQNITSLGSMHHDSYSYDFSQYALSPGNYRIYPSFLPDGATEHVIADPVNGRRHFINLTVNTAGEYIYSNPENSISAPDVHISGITTDLDLHVGFSGDLAFHVVNNGALDYTGKFNLTLFDSLGQEIVSFTSTSATIAAGTNVTAHATVPAFNSSDELIQAGTYSLQFSDNNGTMLSDRVYSIEIKNGKPLSVWTSDESIEVTNYGSMPSIVVKGEMWPHTPYIYTQQTQRNMALRLAFYAPGGNAALNTLLCYQGTIDPMHALFHLNPVTVDVPFGTYEVCYRKGYGQISRRSPVRVGESIDRICYLPTESSSVSASGIPAEDYSGEIVIPSSAYVGGADRKVAAIETEAFMSRPLISVIDLPSTIESIGLNAFTFCTSLQQIIIRAEEPPFEFRNHIAPGLNPSVAFYVPSTAFDSYQPLLSGYNPLYVIVESVESREITVNGENTSVSLAVSPAHSAVDPAFVITDCDDSGNPVAEVAVQSVESGRLNLSVKGLRKGTATFHIRPAHRSDDYSVLTVIVAQPAAIEDITVDPAPAAATTYDLLGRPVSPDASAGTPRIGIKVGPDGKAAKVLLKSFSD